MSLKEYTDVLPMDVAVGGKTYAKRWQAGMTNSRTQHYWLHRLRCLALSAFEWVNVPEDIDPRFIELCMLDYGMGGLFDMSSDGSTLVDSRRMFAFAQAAPISRLNMYWNPNKVRLIPANGGLPWLRHAYWYTQALFDKTIKLNPADSVILFDNINRTHILPMLMMFARRLAHIDRIIDINLHAQATPYILSGPEEARKDMVNYYKMLGGHEPAIIKNKTSVFDVSVLQTDAPYVADKLLFAQNTILNQALDLLGVNNTTTDKRERMIVSEIQSNNEDIALMRRSRLWTRQEFCEKANKIFGLDMSVHYAVTTIDFESGGIKMVGSDFDTLQQNVSTINEINASTDLVPDEGSSDDPE